MLGSCESLQDLCRRVIIRSIGSRRLAHKLPLPNSLIEWLKEYEEPTKFDRICSTSDVGFSCDDGTITFQGSLFMLILYHHLDPIQICFMIPDMGEVKFTMRKKKHMHEQDTRSLTKKKKSININRK
jgi:hypothetical protein